MTELQKVEHYSINGRYRVVIERAASVKGVLGYKVEANGDNLDDVVEDAKKLKAAVEQATADVPKVTVEQATTLGNGNAGELDDRRVKV